MGDAELIQIVDAGMAEAARRSGDWLLCKAGCTQCCHGPFEITGLDAMRLREALARLDPETAERVMERARAYMERAGNIPVALLLDDESMDEEPCPALDPATGLCDLYNARPITCRTFGPPARAGDGSYSVCELCYEGASEEQIAACWVDPDPDGLEAELLAGQPGVTFVAAALIGS